MKIQVTKYYDGMADLGGGDLIVNPLHESKTNPNDMVTPFQHTDHGQGHYRGLTKREYFAAMAMQGLCATDMLRDKSLHRQIGDEDLTQQAIAIAAISIADALIEQLNK